MRIVFVGDLVRQLEKEACPVAAEVTLGEAMELPVGSPMWSHCVRCTARPPSPELMHSELFKSVYFIPTWCIWDLFGAPRQQIL